jgi:hypothetical protein
MVLAILSLEKRLLIVLVIVQFALMEQLVLDMILELAPLVVEYIVAANFRLVLVTLGMVVILEYLIVPPSLLSERDTPQARLLAEILVQLRLRFALMMVGMEPVSVLAQ